MTRKNTTEEKNYFQMYLDAEAAMNNAHDTLTAALCAMDGVENELIGGSVGAETISALYGIRRIIRSCRDDLAAEFGGVEVASMSANCE